LKTTLSLLKKSSSGASKVANILSLYRNEEGGFETGHAPGRKSEAVSEELFLTELEHIMDSDLTTHQEKLESIRQSVAKRRELLRTDMETTVSTVAAQSNGQ
jgi:hypothetical protein